MLTYDRDSALVFLASLAPQLKKEHDLLSLLNTENYFLTLSQLLHHPDTDVCRSSLKILNLTAHECKYRVGQSHDLFFLREKVREYHILPMIALLIQNEAPLSPTKSNALLAMRFLYTLQSKPQDGAPLLSQEETSGIISSPAYSFWNTAQQLLSFSRAAHRQLSFAKKF